MDRSVLSGAQHSDGRVDVRRIDLRHVAVAVAESCEADEVGVGAVMVTVGEGLVSAAVLSGLVSTTVVPPLPLAFTGRFRRLRPSPAGLVGWNRPLHPSPVGRNLCFRQYFPSYHRSACHHTAH